MLPAHYYPKFKKYPHFIGNYGNAWHLQQKEFEAFNGTILSARKNVRRPLSLRPARLSAASLTNRFLRSLIKLLTR